MFKKLKSLGLKFFLLKITNNLLKNFKIYFFLLRFLQKQFEKNLVPFKRYLI